MSIWDLASNSIHTSMASADYFAKLIKHVDNKCAEIDRYNERFADQAKNSGAVLCQITKDELTDQVDAHFTEYKSRSRTIRVYCNWPIGHLFVELNQLIPFTGKRKAWALKITRDQFFDKWEITKIGNFLDDYSGVIPYTVFGDFLIDQLLKEEVTEEDLQDRCAFVG
jgi:hypothetical protein